MIDDPVEKAVANALTYKGIKFTHETSNKAQGLDFHLTDLDVYIECKAFYAERIVKQIEGKQVILVQGYKAASAFYELLCGDSK